MKTLRFSTVALLAIATASPASAAGHIDLTGVPGSSTIDYSFSGSFNVDVFGTGTITRSSLTFVNVDFVALSPSYVSTTSPAAAGGSISVNGIGSSPLTTISLSSDGLAGDDLTLEFNPAISLQGDVNAVAYSGSGSIDISPNVFGADVFPGSGTFTAFSLGGGPGGTGGGVPGAGPFTLTIAAVPEPAAAAMAFTGLLPFFGRRRS